MSALPRRILTVAAAVAVVGAVAAVSMTSEGKTADAAPALDDATIVAIFDAANTYDIETGALAAKKGSTPDVREFGEMLTRDHEHVRKLGRDLAASLKVTPTPPKDFALATAHADAMRTLKTATGREFDRAFLKHEVAFHSAVIDAVTTTLLPALRNDKVKDLVTKVAPAFAAHRDKAQSMLDNLR
jgi:putative membrane protein